MHPNEGYYIFKPKPSLFLSNDVRTNIQKIPGLVCIKAYQLSTPLMISCTYNSFVVVSILRQLSSCINTLPTWKNVLILEFSLSLSKSSFYSDLLCHWTQVQRGVVRLVGMFQLMLVVYAFFDMDHSMQTFLVRVIFVNNFHINMKSLIFYFFIYSFIIFNLWSYHLL